MTSRVYVGTYAKYNNGSLKGAWLDLENYSDHDAFMKACAELHKDEAEAELMFQDFEGFPRGFYGESYIKPELWDWLELNEEDRELLAVYQEHVRDEGGTIDEARQTFAGKHDTMSAWAAAHLEDTGQLESIPEHLRNYFDYQAYANDAQSGGTMVFVRHDGDVWAFQNY